MPPWFEPTARRLHQERTVTAAALAANKSTRVGAAPSLTGGGGSLNAVPLKPSELKAAKSKSAAAEELPLRARA